MAHCDQGTKSLRAVFEYRCSRSIPSQDVVENGLDNTPNETVNPFNIESYVDTVDRCREGDEAWSMRLVISDTYEKRTMPNVGWSTGICSMLSIIMLLSGCSHSFVDSRFAHPDGSDLLRDDACTNDVQCREGFVCHLSNSGHNGTCVSVIRISK